jgi:uncharacterized membrane protein
MVLPSEKNRALDRCWLLLGLGAVVFLCAVALRRPPNGSDHAHFLQFIGRFHPLVVHLPIALIFLVPVLELAGAAVPRAHLRATTGFVLWLATIAALGAALDGWLLAWSGGYRGALVTRHMWGGIALAALCLATSWVRLFSARRRFDGKAPGRTYPLLLGVLLGLLIWTSDQGGKLTHGDAYLTEYMPGRFRRWLGMADAPATRSAGPAAPATGGATLYAARIQPLFNRSCVSCHGPDKAKGGFRLDSYARLMQGGEDGSAIEPWRPEKSELLRRITLNPDDDDFMPSNNKGALSGAEVKLIQQWVAAGASDQEPADVYRP